MNAHRQLTKAQRRRLRELSALAYERDLGTELSGVESDFKRWRAGEIDASELCEAIHRFHQGPAPSLFKIYQHPYIEYAVAHAIYRGLISEQEVGADLMENLELQLDFICSQKENDAEQSDDSPIDET